MTTPQSRSVFAVISGLVLISIIIASALAQGSRDAAASAISEAEQSIGSGYVAVLDAEEAGGNVTNLLAALNDAVALLVDARRAFNVSRFEEATGLAESASAAGGTVQSDAERLATETNEANATRKTRFLIASCVAVPLVLVANFLTYRYFKQQYYQRLLKMKPEVEKS